ncbi:hypothetical protein QBC44DRAFT_138655 [Cladorrhinum sp. PSN332]|nr:hypothetical protein QBC44DRAFT_138655 [Cladorrhinum sp. PSN332]
MANTRGENAPQEHKFINDNRTNARRISDETWERLKPVIVKQYKDKTLEEVIEYMRIHHDFTPTRRQYVHRLGKIWHITKYAPKGGNGQANYKRPPPKPPSPTNGDRHAPDAKSPRNISVKPNGNTNGQLAESPHLWPRRPSPSSQQPFGGRGGNWRLGVAPPSGPPTPEPLHPPSPLPSDNELEPEQYQPRLETPQDTEKQRQLAEILLALGDPHYAFTIWVALHKVDPREEYVINSLRSAQSATQAKKAHAMIDAHLNQLRGNGRGTWTDNEEDSWERFLFDILGARIYDWGVYIGMGFRQIEKAILQRVGADEETGREDLKKLKKRPREPAFDVPALQFLSFALERYNEPAMHDDEFIDVDEVLRQFERQQPVFDELQKNPDAVLTISSLPECLGWCISVLESNPVPPVAIEHNSDINDRTTQFYSLLLTLWHALYNRASTPPAWVQKTDSQFAISPTQLLSTVTGMILTCSPPSTSPLLSAQYLSALSGPELVSQFRKRIFSSTIELMNRAEPKEDTTTPLPPVATPSPTPTPTPTLTRSSSPSGNITPNLINPLRRFVTSTLGIVGNDLPALQEDTADIFCHLVAENEDLPSGPGKKVVVVVLLTLLLKGRRME